MGPINEISDNCRSLYIRGDIGANFFHSSQVNTSGSDYQFLISPDASISNSIGYTGGVGYQLLPKLRGDVTFTYRPNLNVSVLDNTPEIGRGTLRNYTVMANLYLDIDYFNLPLMPYFMGGIGSSWFKGYNNLNWPVFQINEYGQTKQNFAWQIGAGTSYKVCENFLIDFSYQFIALGTGSYTGHYDRFTVAPYSQSLYGAPTQFTNIYDNQIQVGLRYYIA
jgi:opacity protein-like surface antigen